MSDLTGRTLGDFLVKEQIGAGGHGVVYRAQQQLLRRDAVIKVVRHAAIDRALTERFLREARLASQLDHPYAAHVYAFGVEPDGLMWIAMELVRGTPLDRMLASSGPMPIERFLPLMQRICEVVQSAHERGIVHRDLKPANVMVLARSGLLLPKLLDFGVAKQVSDDRGGDDALPFPSDALDPQATLDHKLTQDGALVGSPHYMAPELWINKGVGAATDVYALGVMAYEVLTGRPPFRGKTLTQVARGHARDPVPALGLALPAALDGVLARAMAKRAAERFPSVLELAQALHAASGLAVEPTRLPQLEEPVREAALAELPQPIAELVAALDAARSVHQGRDTVRQLVRVIVRVLGLYALAARSRGGGGEPSATERELVRTLCRRGLSEREWVTLAAATCAPFVAGRELHPLPDLIDLFFDSAGNPSTSEQLVRMLELEDQPAEETSEQAVRERLGVEIPALSALLRRVAFLGAYRIARVRRDGGERWMGVRRPHRVFIELRGAPARNGDVVLLDALGVPLLQLAPLLRIEAPTPGAPEELFLYEGPGKQGARMVAPPAGFTLVDDDVSEWFRTTLLGGDGGAQERRAQQEEAPYLGLRAFGPAQAGMFFGREREVELVLNRLRTTGLVAVVGPSGAGKSSFVHAGVVPALSPGARVAATRPGNAPLRSAAHALRAAGLPDLLREALSPEPAPIGSAEAPVVLVVDQFEELFTQCDDAEERRRFAEALVALSQHTHARVLLTLRDDFLMRTQEVPILRDALRAGLHLLSTPAREDLRRIFIEPARRVGYELDDPKLADEVVGAVEGVPGALPLLSFTAAQLWEMRDRHFHQLTRKAYLAMGGVGVALGQHADRLLAGVGADQQRLIREAFRHLVTASGTRATLSRSELDQLLGGGDRASAVIERLIDSRLVITAERTDGAAIVEIAHEALISAWPRLVTWRGEDAEGARLRDQLRAAARQWDERGRPRGLLWRDDALAELQLWRGRHRQALTDVEDAFVVQSTTAAAKGRAFRRRLIGGTMVALAAVSFALFQLNREARRGAAEARARLASSQEEQGRRHLLDGDPGRALVYLVDALKLGRDGRETRLMVAHAAHQLAAQRAVLGTQADEVREVVPDGHGGALSCGADGVHHFTRDGVAASPRLHAGARFLVDRPRQGLLLSIGAGSARLWRADDPAPLRTFEGVVTRPLGFPGGPADLSPDGRWVAIAEAGGDAAVYDLASPTVRRWPGPAGAGAMWVRFSPDGARVAIGGHDGSIRLVRVRDGAELASAREHAGIITLVVWSQDGRWLLSGADDGSVRVWSTLPSLRRTHELSHPLPVIDGAFSPDGKRFFTIGEGDARLQLWSVERGRPAALLVGHRGHVTHAVFDATGKRILTAATDGLARVWDVASGRALGVLEGHRGEVTDAAWADGGEEVITGGTDGTVRSWSPSVGGPSRVLDAGTALVQAVLLPEPSRVLATTTDSGLLTWDLSVAPPVNRRYTLPGTAAGGLALWRSDGSSAVGWHGADAFVFEPSSGHVLATAPVASAAIEFAGFSRDGARVATVSKDGSAQVWSARDGSAIARCRAHDARLDHVAFSADGERIVVSAEDGLAFVLSLPGCAVQTTLRGHIGRVESAAISADGSTIVTAGLDQTLRTWDAHTGKLRAVLVGHVAEILYAELSPDGHLIASAALDGVKVWSLDDARLLMALDEGAAQMVQFSGDGQHLTAAHVDGRVAVYDLRPDARTAAELAELVRCQAPFELRGDAILPVAEDPRCRAH